MSERQPDFLIEDIIQSITKIFDYTYGLSFEEFTCDSKTIDAVIRNFEIIGEASGRLPEEFKENINTIDWHKIRGFRNRIVHDYMGIDYSIIWTIKNDFLPQLLSDLTNLKY